MADDIVNGDGQA